MMMKMKASINSIKNILLLKVMYTNNKDEQVIEDTKN